MTLPALSADPRGYHTLVLSLFLLYGMVFLSLDITWLQVAATLATALITQWAGVRLLRIKRLDLRSPLITALSLALLLRTETLWMAALGALLAVGGKFLIRWNNKHIFNPSNFALGVMMVAGLGWTAPGQWGNTAALGLTLAALGGGVLFRAARWDITLAAGFFYLAILWGRALWLGDPFSIPLHQMSSGSFLLFTFFMISDPKATPNSWQGRLLFAFLVTALAGVIRFGLYTPNGLIWALFLLSPLVPLLDRLLPAPAYGWDRPSANRLTRSF